MYARFMVPNFKIASNRGASGIDGTVATALGFACGLKRPVTVVLGDLACIHDLNALAQSSEIKTAVIIVVINNHGGGIFSFLPIAKFPQYFEKFFAAPHDLSFEKIARVFGIEYHKVNFNHEFVPLYRSIVKGNKAVLIEIETERNRNSRIHAQLQEKISQVLNKFEFE